MTTSLVGVLLALLGVAIAAGWIARRAWLVYRHHFRIEGRVWLEDRHR